MAGNPESHDRAMILQAPSPGGPIEVFEVPEESSAEAEEGPAEESRIDQESSLDLGQPSSSSPAPKEPEAWRTWKIKEFPDLSTRSARDKDRPSKGKGCWKRGGALPLQP